MDATIYTLEKIAEIETLTLTHTRTRTHKQGACLIRVPTENVKQNLQAGRYKSSEEAIRTILKSEGVMGFYKGFLSTVFREV